MRTTIEALLAIGVVAATLVAGYALREVFRLKKALLSEMQRALELDVTHSYRGLLEKTRSGT